MRARPVASAARNSQTLGGNGNVVVTITDAGANDVLTVTASNCAGLSVGSVELGGDYVTTTKSYSGNGSNASTVTWTASSNRLTIRLGSPNGGTSGLNTGVAAGFPTYNPASGISDLFGNPIAGSFTSGVASRF